MWRSFRFVIYLAIGLAIYFLSGADKDPAVMDKIHQSAPIAIILVVGLLVFVKFMRGRQDKS